jgi:hypothetical protein
MFSAEFPGLRLRRNPGLWGRNLVEVEGNAVRIRLLKILFAVIANNFFQWQWLHDVIPPIKSRRG